VSSKPWTSAAQDGNSESFVGYSIVMVSTLRHLWMDRTVSDFWKQIYLCGITVIVSVCDMQLMSSECFAFEVKM
jgi:hypothetical protein